jgi:ribosomal protein L18
MEKRKRNRDYARKFQSKTGGSRRQSVVEAKRLVVASSEEKFQAQVYKMTTDEDMPAYTGFDFSP